MIVTLVRLGAHEERLASIVLNADGRADAPLLDRDTMRTGRYRLVFETAAYFRARDATLADPPSSRAGSTVHGDGVCHHSKYVSRSSGARCRES